MATAAGRGRRGGARARAPGALCRLADLTPGRGRLFEIRGEGVALFRVGDQVYAVENACPHRQGPLAFGEVRGKTAYCPVHAWPFDLETGRCLEVPGAAVRTYRVRIEGGDVVVEPRARIGL